VGAEPDSHSEPASAGLARIKRAPVLVWAGVGLVLLLAAGGAVALQMSQDSSSGESKARLTGSGYANGDLANTREVDGSIKTTNVNSLEVAWTLPLEGRSTYGSYAASPIMSEGVVYIQDLGSNVQAIDQETGEILWTKSYEVASHGPNGVVVMDGRVHGATATEAFALDQKTGRELWSVELTRNDSEAIDMAPGYYDGVVYVSTVSATQGIPYVPGGVGILWALDAKTGKKLWKWNTVPDDLWGNPKVNAGGGLWYTPAFDDRGFMYFGVANAGPDPGTGRFPWGSSRPGPNLYTNSIVKLDARDGRMEWYFQQLPHGLYEWDFQGPPILAEVDGEELVVAGGKSGFVIAFDRQTGKPVWQRAVGIHNGHDKDNLYAMRGEYSKLSLGEKIYPGSAGGVIAPMSTDGSSIFVATVDNPSRYIAQTDRDEPGPFGGELFSLDLASGAVNWSFKFSELPFGSTTVVNDLVFTTTYGGKIYGFDASSGRLAWEAGLPAGTNAGVMVEGDTLIAGAGVPEEGKTPEIVAYRLGGE
jgi:outer membrane protein assembly factor BamB